MSRDFRINARVIISRILCKNDLKLHIFTVSNINQ